MTELYRHDALPRHGHLHPTSSASYKYGLLVLPGTYSVLIDTLRANVISIRARHFYEAFARQLSGY